MHVPIAEHKPVEPQFLLVMHHCIAKYILLPNIANCIWHVFYNYERIHHINVHCDNVAVSLTYEQALFSSRINMPCYVQWFFMQKPLMNCLTNASGRLRSATTLTRQHVCKNHRQSLPCWISSNGVQVSLTFNVCQSRQDVTFIDNVR